MLVKDLPGQLMLFPHLEAAPAVVPTDAKADAYRLLADGLPNKDTVSVPEAAALMYCCRRTVENWISDGTLLVAYANRNDEAQRKHARIIVRAGRDYDARRTQFLTLAELRIKRSNVGGN